MTSPAFHGDSYLHQTPDGERPIGVHPGLGSGTWIVAWKSDAGGLHRVKSPRLPAGADPASLQQALDSWAAERGLRRLKSPAPAESPESPESPESSPSSPSSPSHSPADSMPALRQLPTLPTIPDGWEAKAALVDQCMAAGQRLTLWIARLVCVARDDFPNPAEWVAACTERWGFAKAYLHHMHAIGSLLGRVSPGTLATLSLLHWEKLYCISRLPANLVGHFLEKAMPAHLSRDEVRCAVNRWLKAAGEPADESPEKHPPSTGPNTSRAQHQQDFLDALFAEPPPELSDPQVWHDRVYARAATVTDTGAAQMVAFRSLVCVEALLPQIASASLPAVAEALRTIAAQADGRASGLLLPAPSPDAPPSPKPPKSHRSHSSP